MLNKTELCIYRSMGTLLVFQTDEGQTGSSSSNTRAREIGTDISQMKQTKFNYLVLFYYKY